MTEEIQVPKKLPGNGHEVIVDLETIHHSTPEFDTAPSTHETIGYEYSTAQDDIADRLKFASIVLTVTCPINAQTLGEAPYLKCVVTRTTGTDHVDLQECRRRGIVVVRTPGVSSDAVSEQAMALYFASRRRLTVFHDVLYDFDENKPNQWKAKGSLADLGRTRGGKVPPTCRQEVAGIIGYGAIGKRIATLCQALGMTVLVSGRKNETVAVEGRVPFAEVIERATVLMLSVPLTEESRNLIDTAELATMREDAVIVNIARGGIVNERALLDALGKGQIYGYGSDVFEKEPAGGSNESVLLGDEAKKLNVVLSPHLAWFGQSTMVNVKNMVKLNIDNFVKGVEFNVVS